MSQSPQRKTKSSKRSSKTTASPVKETTKRLPYVTPFTFDEERLVFGKVEEKKKTDKATGNTATFYQPELKYRYEDGSVGKLVVRFGSYVRVDNFIPTKNKRTFKLKEGELIKEVSGLVAGLIFDPNTDKPPMPKRQFYPDADRHETITQKELIEAITGENGFYARFRNKLASWIIENIPDYKRKKLEFVKELNKMMPEPPKDKVSKEPISNKPDQIYYDLTSYEYVKDDKIIPVQTKVVSISGKSYDFSELASSSIEGDISATFSRFHIDSKLWSAKANLGPIVITNIRPKTDDSSAQLNEMLDQYKDNEELKQEMARKEQELMETLKRKNREQQELSKQRKAEEEKKTEEVSSEEKPRRMKEEKAEQESSSKDDEEENDDDDETKDDIRSILNM